MRQLRSSFAQNRTWLLWMLLMWVFQNEAFGAPTQEENFQGLEQDAIEEPLTKDVISSSRRKEENDSNELLGDTPKIDLQNTAYEEFGNSDPPEPRTISKRSTDGYESFMLSHGYDPYNAWAKKNIDPGLQSYMLSTGYDPMMAWGRRKRQPQTDYLESIGYNPYFMFKKNRPQEDFEPDAEDYYSRHFSANEENPNDHFMESAYFPHQFFHGYKRYFAPNNQATHQFPKRSPTEMGARGFHDGIFTQNFGEFSPVRRRKRSVEKMGRTEKRRPEMDASGFYGDTFSKGFGDFYTMKKRKFGMDASGFHGDTFNDGWGTFSTMRKRRPEWDASGFHGGMFSDGFGDFDTMKKRHPEIDPVEFYANAYLNANPDLSRLEKVGQKRRPEMTASGFHGDMFSDGFGGFDTMRKRLLVSNEGSSDPENEFPILDTKDFGGIRHILPSQHKSGESSTGNVNR